jgi:YD repeat-containing protein
MRLSWDQLLSLRAGTKIIIVKAYDLQGNNWLTHKTNTPAWILRQDYNAVGRRRVILGFKGRFGWGFANNEPFFKGPPVEAGVTTGWNVLREGYHIKDVIALATKKSQGIMSLLESV